MIKNPPHATNGDCAYCRIYTEVPHESLCGHDGHLHVAREINDGKELLLECDMCNKQTIIARIAK
jgi:hypothetical protein